MRYGTTDTFRVFLFRNTKTLPFCLKRGIVIAVEIQLIIIKITMKNKILILILLSAIVIPQIASAVWWNPASWFKEKTPIDIPLNEGTEQVSTTSKMSTTEPQIIEKEIIKEVPVEKIIEKIVTKPDQSVINENNSLKNKIKELEIKLQALQATSTQCFVDLNKLQERIKELEAPLSQTEIRRRELNIQIANIDIEISRVYAGYYDSSICSSNLPSCDEGWQTHPTIRPPQSLLDKKVGSFQVQKAQLQLELSKL